MTLYKGIDSVVDSVAQLQDSDEINVPSWLFLDDDLHTVVAGQDDFDGSGSDPFRTDGIENETRGGSSGSPQGVLQDAVDTSAAPWAMAVGWDSTPTTTALPI